MAISFLFLLYLRSIIRHKRGKLVFIVVNPVRNAIFLGGFFEKKTFITMRFCKLGEILYSRVTFLLLLYGEG